MDASDAAACFSCLGHDVRLRLFRTLAATGPDGDVPGRMARSLGLAPSTVSFHLAQLENCGLIFSWKVGRSVRYAVNLLALRMLALFLVEDCCGDPALCGDLVALTRPNDGLNDVGAPAMNADRVYNVLFLCTGNSARSIIAECMLNRLGQGKFQAFSAGSQPAGEVNPHALRLLKAQNFPTANLRSKSWDEFAADGAPQMDFVFTVCDNAAAEVCPIWPGQPMSAHWGVPDPAAVEGSDAVKAAAFAETMKFMQNRISVFVNLPLRALDRLSLQTRLDAIGDAAHAPA